MADDNDADFLDIINSVFPSSIPKQFLEKVDIHMNDGEGNTFVQTLEENKMPNEFPVDISFAKDPRLYETVDLIEIFVDVKKVKEYITTHVTDTLNNL